MYLLKPILRVFILIVFCYIDIVNAGGLRPSKTNNEAIMITGPEVSTRSGNAPKQLIVFLHGVGADGDDLIGISDVLKQHFPDAYFISPNAPEPYDKVPFGLFGRQWFSFQDMSEPALIEGLNSVMGHLNKFIDYQLKRFDLTEKDLAVVGFSQGSMVALHTFIRRPKPIALVVAFSGTIVGPHLLKKELKSKPSIILLHGKQDQVVLLKYMNLSYQALKQLGLDVKKYIYEDLGHGINQEGINETINALKRKFSKSPV